MGAQIQVRWLVKFKSGGPYEIYWSFGDKKVLEYVAWSKTRVYEYLDGRGYAIEFEEQL